MIISFLKTRIKYLLLLAAVCAVFAVTFSLYGLPVEAVAYAGAISLFILIVFAVTDFIFFCAKTLALKKAKEETTVTLDALPKPSGSVEAEYDAIVRKLFGERSALENEAAKSLADMSDYYTAWAHQVKTPIAAMRLILQGEDPDTAELSEHLRRIEQYTEMVMGYLRVNSESSDYLLKEYDIDGIVRQAVRKFSAQFIRKKLYLKYEPLGISAVTDEKQLLFVIEQVISNSLKYTNSGGVEIYTEAPSTLCIKDTGIGVLPEDLPRIFEKGYTGVNGRIDKKASGIGLYLCKRICDKLGHGITAESGGGTVIKIDLSRAEVGFDRS